MTLPIIVGFILLLTAGAVYVRLRWRRAPQAYRAMVVVAAGYLVVGAVLGGWVVHLMMLPSSTAVAMKGPSLGARCRHAGTA